MADVKQLQFGQRLRRITAKRRKLARGYVTTIDPNGLIVARPHRRRAHHVLRSLLLCLFVLIGFKVFLFAALGAEAYQARLERLQAGSLLDRVGAYVMAPDPLVVRLAGLVGRQG